MALDDPQIELLRRLTSFVRWAGRYPVAANEKATQEPRVLKSGDYLTLIGMAQHLSNIHLGRKQ